MLLAMPQKADIESNRESVMTKGSVAAPFSAPLPSRHLLIPTGDLDGSCLPMCFSVFSANKGCVLNCIDGNEANRLECFCIPEDATHTTT
jgi:hypothetical protein